MRWQVALLLTLLLPAAVRAEIFMVTKTEDTMDGVCDADCSLREAVAAAALNTEADTILLGPFTYPLTLEFDDGSGGVSLDVVGDDVTIRGSGMGVTRILAQNDARVLSIREGPRVQGALLASLTLEELTLAGGRADEGAGTRVVSGRASFVRVRITDCVSTGIGGAILNTAGTVDIRDSVLDANIANIGAAFFTTGEIRIETSSIVGNLADDSPGGGFGQGFGTAEILNTTISGNGFLPGAEARWALGPVPAGRIARSMSANSWNLPRGTFPQVIFTNCTLANNQGSFPPFITVRNSILALNRPANCAFPIVSEGGNLDDDGTCVLSGPGDFVADSRLRPLRDNGGPGETHAFTASAPSPAQDSALTAFCPPTDQRGVSRSNPCDIGAFELGEGATLRVNSAGFLPDQTPGDGACDTGNLVEGVPECTILAAVQESNSFSEADLIILPAGVISLDAGFPGCEADCSSLSIRHDLTMVGSSGAPSVLSGGGLVRPVDIVDPIIQVRLGRLVVADGVGLLGGGILNRGDLTLVEATVRDSGAERGGGVCNLGGTPDAGAVGGILQVVRSSIVQNQATAEGGGLFNTGRAEVFNSTFSGNRANDGGGVLNESNGNFFGVVQLTASTVADNTGLDGIGGIAGRASATISHSLVALNPGGDCSGVASVGDNLDSDGSCGLGPEELSNIPEVELALAPLGDFDGPTPTHALLPGSPAVDAASDCVVSTDQRFSNRPFDGTGDGRENCDIGAYEAPPFQPSTARRPLPPVSDFLDPQAAYRMLGTPLALGDPDPNRIIAGSLRRPAPDFWRLLRFDEAAGGYRSFLPANDDPFFDFEQQRGFWLISREGGEVVFTGVPSDASGAPVDLLIPTGRSQIAFPFNFDVDWDCVRRRLTPAEQAALTLCAFDCLAEEGCGYLTLAGAPSPDHAAPAAGGRLQPAVGYFAINTGPAILLRVPPICASPAPTPQPLFPDVAAPPAPKLPEWSLRLSLHQGKLSDGDNYLGVHADPDGGHGLDRPEPPSITGLSLAIVEDGSLKPLSRDFRPGDQGHWWRIDVSTPRRGDAELRWELVGELPQGLFLRDLETGRLLELNRKGAYVFSARGALRRFEVISHE